MASIGGKSTYKELAVKNGSTGIRGCFLLWFMYAVSTSCSSESSHGIAMIDINTGSVERVHLSSEDWLVTVTADKKDTSQICMQSVRLSFPPPI